MAIWGVKLAILGVMLAILVVKLAILGAKLGTLRATLAILGAKLAVFDVKTVAVATLRGLCSGDLVPTIICSTLELLFAICTLFTTH